MQENIKKLFEHHNGTLTSKDAHLAGINNKALQRLCDNGAIERISKGIYIDSNHLVDEYWLAQYRCPKGIFSYETALFLRGLIDRIPLILTLTIPKGYNTRLLKNKDKYKFFYNTSDIYVIGISTIKTSFGNTVNIYNKERTICDCVKKKNVLDSDLVLSALKQYMSEPGNDYNLLLEYAEQLNIRSTIKKYMEVLI